MSIGTPPTEDIVSITVLDSVLITDMEFDLILETYNLLATGSKLKAEGESPTVIVFNIIDVFKSRT